jgi:hypothetical protein
MAGVKILYGIEKALENFLHTICEDYSLNYDELYERYFLPNGEDLNKAESSELPDGIPEGHKRTNKTKNKKKPTASNGSVATTSNPNRKLCCALTTKKTPCKKFAIDGTDFCTCHSNGAKSVTTANRNPTPSEIDDDASSVPIPKPKVTKPKSKPKPKAKEPMPVTPEEDDDVSEDEAECSTKSKGKTKGKGKKSDSFPVHTHPVDTEDVHSDCELCNDVGNSMIKHEEDNDDDDDATQPFDLDADMKTRLQNILSKIDENSSGSDTDNGEE